MGKGKKDPKRMRESSQSIIPKSGERPPQGIRHFSVRSEPYKVRGTIEGESAKGIIEDKPIEGLAVCTSVDSKRVGLIIGYGEGIVNASVPRGSAIPLSEGHYDLGRLDDYVLLTRGGEGPVAQQFSHFEGILRKAGVSNL